MFFLFFHSELDIRLCLALAVIVEQIYQNQIREFPRTDAHLYSPQQVYSDQLLN